MPKRPRFVDPNAAPDEDLTSRTDLREERVAREEELLRLAAALVGLGDATLAKLELPDGLREAVDAARRIKAAAARNRALRLVRAALRDIDAAALSTALARVHRGGGPPRR